MSLNRFFKHSHLKFSFLALLLLMTYGHTQAQLPTGDNVLGVRLDWHPLGEMIAASENSSVQIYDANNDQIIRDLPIFSNFVTDVAWNPDGTKLAVANGHEIQIWREPWDINTLQPELVIQSPVVNNDLGIVMVDWHPSSEKILGVNTPKAYIWDTTTGQLIETITSQHSAILSAIWSNDGEKIARGDMVGGVVIDNLANDTREFSEFFDRSGVYALSWSSGGDKVAAGSGSGILQIFGFSPFFTGSGYIETEAEKIISLAWNPSDEHLIASGSTDGNVTVWDVQTQQAVVALQAGSAVPSIDWSPDGQKLVYGFEGGFDIVDLVGVSTLTPSTAPTATPTVSLRSIFNLPSCAASCWLGIEPGVTTQADLESILSGLNIQYDVSPIGLEGNTFDYSFNPNNEWPYVGNNQGSVGILVGDGVVLQMIVPLADVPIDTIVDQYGSPDRIVGPAENRVLVYASHGLAFFVSRTDSTIVTFAWFSTQDGIAYAFVDNPNYPDVQPCTQPANLCELETATPSPSG